jgi:DNA/RNA-binding domain of Phe-tRNA-synthetase-like protein
MPWGLTVTVAAELQGRARLGVLALDGVSVQAADAALAAEIEAYAKEVRTRYAGTASGSVPETEEARALYKAIGIDPTKTRPSSEALLRRVLKGDALYVVNTLVDATNLVSLKVQLPFGLYDRARLSPPIVLRRGGAGESYQGIRKAAVHLDGRPVLSDGGGPFGNPSSDSARSMITLETRLALVVVYAPARATDARLLQVLDLTEATLRRYCAGDSASRSLL